MNCCSNFKFEMSRDEKKKGKLFDIEDNDLERSLVPTPNLHIENAETPTECVAEIDPELNDSSHVQMTAPLVEQVRLHCILHYFRLKIYAKVAIHWNYIRIDVGLKIISGGMFCTLQAMQGRWMPLKDVGCHKDFETAREAFLMYHKLYPVRAICIFGLVVLPFFEVLEESLALDKLKNEKIHGCGRASELQKELAFSD